MGNKQSRISLSLLILAVALGNAGAAEVEDKSVSNELGFTVRGADNNRLIWGVKTPEGKPKKVTEEEERRLFDETIFPRVLRNAEAGKQPEVWQIGFFYLDGKGTDSDLERAEAAFRAGMSLDRPEGLLYLGNYYQTLGIDAQEDVAKRDEYFAMAESIYREVLDGGFEMATHYVIPLAKAHLFGWYGLEIDAEKADELLAELENVAPDNPSCQLWRAKVFVHQKRYPEAFDYAEKAQLGLLKESEGDVISESVAGELKLAGALKITAAVLGGEISKIDPDEFLQISKESLGLTGPMAWSVPVILLLILVFLLWRTQRAWNSDEAMRPGLLPGPGLRLSIMWISAAILAAGIGFNISLPGLNNGLGHWIGAILVTLVCLFAMTVGGWRRYFGSGPFLSGSKAFLLGLGIVIVGVVGMQVVAMGYAALYEMILGRGLDQQLVSLFLESENLWQLLGTVLVVGIAIPFYEEVFFRGFFYEAVERRWSARTALVVSSVVFALVHGLTFFVPLLFLSFALGWLRMKNGNLRMSFYLHAANNSFAVLVGHFS